MKKAKKYTIDQKDVFNVEDVFVKYNPKKVILNL